MDTLRLVTALFVFSTFPLTAQDAVWIAPGPHGPSADWFDPANWEEGIVPNAGGATAIFTAYSLGLATTGLDGTGTSTVPGTAPALIAAGDLTLGELQWRLSGSSTQTGSGLTLGSEGASASLRFAGAGLRWVQTQPAGFMPPTINVAYGAVIFAGSSRAGTEGLGNGGVQFVVNHGSSLTFHDETSADDAVISSRGIVRFDGESNAGQSTLSVFSTGDPTSSFLDFWDRSGAGSARVVLGGFATVSFHNAASAENAVFVDEPLLPTGGPRQLTFADDSTAGSATIDLNLAGGGVQFQDRSSAGTASLSLADTSNILTFRDEASADRATVTGLGNVVFTHSATAASATIGGYHIIFRDTANAGSASLAPAFNFATSTIEFRDQSSAGTATLHLGKLGRVVLAGESDAGTATVVVGSGASEGLVVVRDSARTAGLGIMVAPQSRGRLDLSGTNLAEVELRTIEGTVDIDLGASTLAFRSSGGDANATLSGIVSGAGGLVWDRPSTLTMTSAVNDYAGPTSLLQGELRLAGGRVHALEMNAGVRLTGDGWVAGGLDNVGSVSPGASAGTITVEGDYVQGADASLDIELYSPDEHDRLIVAGSASLDGTLNLSVAPGFAVVGNSSFEFLAAAGGITGEFSVDLALGAALSSELVYTANGVALAVAQKPFAGFGGTPAASALGAYFDATLTAAAGSYRDMIVHLNTLPTAGEVAAALAALAPDHHLSLARSRLLTAVAQQADQDRRMATLRGQKERGFEAFFEAGHRSGRVDAIEGQPAGRSRNDGGTAGLQWRNGAGVSFGVSLTKEEVDLKHGDNARARTDSLMPAVTVQYAGETYFLNATIATSRDDHDVSRRIVYAGVDDRVTAAFSGSRTDVSVNAGRTFRAGDWAIVPLLGLLQTRWETDDVVEAGSMAALSLQDWSARVLYARAGIEVSRPAPAFTPVFSVSWLGAASERHSLAARFVSGPAGTYKVAGRAAGRNLVQAGLSLDKAIGGRVVLSFSAAGVWGDKARVRSSITAGLRCAF